jgi:hypothetical protein
MSLLAYRFVRASVLGLMFFLAMTAACSTDSYDPNPYDDTPPVVTVEFNYVVPSRVSLRKPSAQAKIRREAAFSNKVQPITTASMALLASVAAPALQKAYPQLIIPLRR